MKMLRQHRTRLLAAGLMVGWLALAVGCESLTTADSRGGAEMWAQNCMFCHNSRSPSSYSDAEWDVAVQHMRIQARLTAHEHRTIAEFLKSAN